MGTVTVRADEGGPRPRRERSAAYNRRRHSPSRSPSTRGSPGPNSYDYTAAPHIATSHLRPNVDATVGPAHMPLQHLLPPGCFSDTQHASALLLVDWHGHLRPLVAPPLPQVPGAKVFAPKQFVGPLSPCRCQTAPLFPLASTISGPYPSRLGATPIFSFSPTTSAAAST